MFNTSHNSNQLTFSAYRDLSPQLLFPPPLKGNYEDQVLGLNQSNTKFIMPEFEANCNQRFLDQPAATLIHDLFHQTESLEQSGLSPRGPRFQSPDIFYTRDEYNQEINNMGSSTCNPQYHIKSSSANSFLISNQNNFGVLGGGRIDSSERGGLPATETFLPPGINMPFFPNSFLPQLDISNNGNVVAPLDQYYPQDSIEVRHENGLYRMDLEYLYGETERLIETFDQHTTTKAQINGHNTARANSRSSNTRGLQSTAGEGIESRGNRNETKREIKKDRKSQEKGLVVQEAQRAKNDNSKQ